MLSRYSRELSSSFFKKSHLDYCSLKMIVDKNPFMMYIIYR